MEEKQSAYYFKDLQMEAYLWQFQQVTEIVVLLFSGHIGFVLESKLKNKSNKFLGATIQMIFTTWPHQRKGLFNIHKAPFTILTTHINLLHPSWHEISCCYILLKYIFH